MRKIPRWVFAVVVLAGLGWSAVHFGVIDRSSIRAEGIIDAVSSAASADRVFTGSAANLIEPQPPSLSNYRSAFVEQRKIIDSVQATGSVRPVALVSVGSEVSGQIRHYAADFNDEVRRGDLLALIDPRPFEIAVEQADAQLGMARSSVHKAEVALREAEAEYERRKTLAARGTLPQAELVRAEAARDLAEAQLQDMTYALDLAQAGLKKARSDLDRTRIHSPVAGTVIHRNIEIGQTVTVGFDAPVLYTIAQDLREMQVNVSIPEAEIGRIRGGQRMEFTVDAYPGRNFEGEVLQVRLQPQTSQNVVTYTVIASAPNPDLLLLPGMTATARIIVDESDTVLSVPTAALRFRLPDEARGGESRVLVKRGDGIVPVPVRLGATDGAYTAIRADALQPGDTVITGLAGGRAEGGQDNRRLLGIF